MPVIVRRFCCSQSMKKSFDICALKWNGRAGSKSFGPWPTSVSTASMKRGVNGMPLDRQRASLADTRLA
jgi:hypothetical protein